MIWSIRCRDGDSSVGWDAGGARDAGYSGKATEARDTKDETDAGDARDAGYSRDATEARDAGDSTDVTQFLVCKHERCIPGISRNKIERSARE
ncbi:MAG: hypothetical protein ABIA59_10945 [Candidatus Latescibacterota bacterium]